MKNRLLSAFLGGFFGILISAYAYYKTGSDNLLLIPLGTFIGCFLGFFWNNLKKVKKTFSRKINFSFLKKNIVISKFLEKISKQNRIKRMFQWFKKHEMNKFMFFEGLILFIILGGICYLFIEIDFFNNIFQNLNSETRIKSFITLAKLFLCFSIILSFLINFHSIFKRSISEFFASYEFYQKWHILGVIIKTSLKFMFLNIEIISLILFLIIFLVWIVVYTLIATAITVILLIFAYLFNYLSELSKNKQEFAIFLTTLIVTTACYFLYRPLFVNQIFIWIVAFMSGVASSLIVKMVLGIGKDKLKRFYFFVSNDYDPEGKITCWPEIAFEKPSNNIIFKINRIIDYFKGKYRKIVILS